MRHQVLGDSLAESLGSNTSDVLQGKGGFWVKGHGFYTIAKARQITGIKATPRKPQMVMSAWGDYATIAQINSRDNPAGSRRNEVLEFIVQPPDDTVR